MKKLFATLLFIIVAPLVAGATLYQFYNLKGQKLPSVLERKQTALECGIKDYIGTALQNFYLEECLRDSDPRYLVPLTPPLPLELDGLLGGAIPVRPTEFKTYLRSEEHTSELQSLAYLVFRLLL